MNPRTPKSLKERYEAFSRDATELLEEGGFARPEQLPKITGRSFYGACVALAAMHFPDDKSVGGLGPRGLIYAMHSAVHGPSINHKDPDPIASARSVALVVKNVIKNRPPLDLVDEPDRPQRPFSPVDSQVPAGKKRRKSVEIDGNLCFVIISFSRNPRLEDFYNKSIKPVVETLGYRCERVDEQEFNNSIRTRIMDNIKKARFIVVDVTEAKPNCYYELGVAHSLEKEVIHLANSSSDIHFDAGDFNFIVYSRIDELAEKLRKRIMATVGQSNR